MATGEFIENWLLEHCNTASSHGCASGVGLTQLHQKVFGHLKSVRKADAARDLARFYADPKNVTAIWSGSGGGLVPSKGLNEAEKAFVTIVVQSGGKEHKPTMKKIAAALGLEFKKEERRYYSHSSDPFNPDYNYGSFHLAFLHLLKQYYPRTAVALLFPGGKKMPPFVLDALKPIIPPFEYRYAEFEPDRKNLVICREGRIGDFAAVVRFASGERLKAKPFSFDVAKAKLARIAEEIGFEEVCDGNGKFCTAKEANRINDFRVALPLFALSAEIGLLDIDTAGDVKPGVRSLGLLSNPPHLLAKKLFEAYAAKNRIYETHYLAHLSIRDGERWLDWAECRKPVIELLKTCPVSRWIEYGDFEKYMAMFHDDFFRRLLSGEVYIQGLRCSYGYNVSRPPDWSECEARIIRLMLSFLGAIGMLDIAYVEGTPRFREDDDDFCVGIAGFRITPLGAWILGMNDKYEAASPRATQPEEGELVVQPDHTVIISGLKSRIVHEARLSGFLTKVSSEDNVSVYKIDFQSMVRAFNSGMEPRAVKAILEKASSRPIPENVARSFADWQAKAGKVKIRTIALLETEDAFILEELVHAGGMEPLLGERIKYASIIADGGNQAKVKAIAERNGWLVASLPATVKRERTH